MKTAYMKLILHVVAFASILIANYGLNYFLAREYIPLVTILYLSIVYFVLYLILTFIFEGFISASLFVRLFSIAMYTLVLCCLLELLSAVIDNVLPIFGWDKLSNEVPFGLIDFHYRVWRSFIVVNFIAAAYILFLQLFKGAKFQKKWEHKLKERRELATQYRYNSHFLKGVFSHRFSFMLLKDEIKDGGIKMDVIHFLGYLLELNSVYKNESLRSSIDHLERFVRLLCIYYGHQSILYDMRHDGIHIADIPIGILLLPLEHCLKNALIAPEFPIIYRLDLRNGEIFVHCSSYVNNRKYRSFSKSAINCLKEKIDNSQYVHELNTRLDGDVHTLLISLKNKLFQKPLALKPIFQD